MAKLTSDDELAELRRIGQRLQLELNGLLERLRKLEQHQPSRGSEPRSGLSAFNESAKSGTPEAGPATQPARPSPPPISPRSEQSQPALSPSEVSPTAPTAEPASYERGRLAERSADHVTSTPAKDIHEPSGGFEAAIGKTWLNRIGALALLAAMTFFVKHSFDQGWISPTMQVLLGAAVGVIFVVAGEYCLYRRMRTFAGGILGCGVGILYIATFGAYSYYHLVGSTAAGILYTAVTIISVAVAVHGRLLPVAILAVIGGFGTPIALSTGINRQVALLTYVLFLDIGFLISASVRRWDVLRILTWVGTLGLFGGWYIEYYEPSAMWTTWGFLLGFYLLFHAEVILCLRRRTFTWPRLIACVITADNVVFFGATYVLWNSVASDWLGLFAVATAAVQWLVAWRLIPKEGVSLNARLALWLGGAAMLALAAPLQFDRYMVSVSWLAQAVVTLCFCRRYAPVWLRAKAIGLLTAAVVHMFAYEYHDAALTHHILESGRWYMTWASVLFVIAASSCYAGAAALVIRRSPSDVDKPLAWALPIVGSALLLWLFAEQWERYLAAWWWLGLTTCWLILALRYRMVGIIAIGLALTTGVKFLLWDTLAATQGPWGDIEGIVLNRAVLTGVLVAGVMGATRWITERLPSSIKHRIEEFTPLHQLTLLALLLITWTGTFEIARAFRFEDWPQQNYGTPIAARNIFITAFWALNAVVVWWIAGTRRTALAGYALVLTVLASLKTLCLDTLSLAASGKWSQLSGICSNRNFIVGLLVITTGILACWKMRRLAGVGFSHWLGNGAATRLLVLVALLTVWVPTFEIIRVFQFEPFRLRFEDTRLAMHVALSILWSIHATACLILGFARRTTALRFFALALYLIAVVKVFLFDLSQLEMVYRIISFMVLGVMLLFASLLYQRLAPKTATYGKTG